MLKKLLLLSAISLLVLIAACNSNSLSPGTPSSTIPNISSPSASQATWTPPLILSPYSPPAGSVTLPGGIRVIPSVASPWPDVPVYENVSSYTEIKTGDKFSIGLDADYMLGYSWTANYDKSVLSLLENKSLVYDQGDRLGTQWFLFKSIAVGPDIITFDLNQSHIPQTSQNITPFMRLPFIIMVTASK